MKKYTIAYAVVSTMGEIYEGDTVFDSAFDAIMSLKDKGFKYDTDFCAYYNSDDRDNGGMKIIKLNYHSHSNK